MNSSTLYSAGIDFSRLNLTSKVSPRAVRVNPCNCAAELFVNIISHSFEAGIANTISSFK